MCECACVRAALRVVKIWGMRFTRYGTRIVSGPESNYV